MTCRRLVRQAARAYSLIRPSTTGFGKPVVCRCRSRSRVERRARFARGAVAGNRGHRRRDRLVLLPGRRGHPRAARPAGLWGGSSAACPAATVAGSVLNLPFQGWLLPLKQRVNEWQLFPSPRVRFLVTLHEFTTRISPNIFCPGCAVCACAMNSYHPILCAIQLAAWRRQIVGSGRWRDHGAAFEECPELGAEAGGGGAVHYVLVDCQGEIQYARDRHLASMTRGRWLIPPTMTSRGTKVRGVMPNPYAEDVQRSAQSTAGMPAVGGGHGDRFRHHRALAAMPSCQRRWSLPGFTSYVATAWVIGTNSPARAGDRIIRSAR